MLFCRDTNNIGEEVIFSWIINTYSTKVNTKVYGVGCHPARGRRRRHLGVGGDKMDIIAGESMSVVFLKLCG